jgi:hypothetical protein
MPITPVDKAIGQSGANRACGQRQLESRWGAEDREHRMRLQRALWSRFSRCKKAWQSYARGEPWSGGCEDHAPGTEKCLRDVNCRID